MQSPDVTVEAKTVEQAIVIACGKLGGSQDAIQYEVIKKTSGGLFSFLTGGGKVTIRAWLKGSSPKERSSSRDRAARSSSQEAPAELSPELRDRVISDLQKFLTGVSQYIVGGRVVEVQHFFHADGRLVYDVQDEEVAQVFEKNHKLIESLEHLLRKRPRYLKQEFPCRVFVDACGSRLRREEELGVLAKDLSKQVSESRKPIVLNYRNPYDRKVIHLSLENDAKVYTKSIGSGPHRKLMILPHREDREKGALSQDRGRGEDFESEPTEP